MQRRCVAPCFIRQFLVGTVCAVMLGCSLRDGNGTLAADSTFNQPSDSRSPNVTLLDPVLNGEGASATATIAASGQIDRSNLFFTAMGNGRSCATCHDSQAGWSVTPESLSVRFDASAGMDPIFRLVDGANSPLAPVGTLTERRRAYSMLLTKGLIRVGLPMPSNAEFELIAVQDPYGFASASELSLFRRPLPATNLKFVSDLMWDGRERQPSLMTDQSFCVQTFVSLRCYASVDSGLLQQANSAVKGHAQQVLGLEASELRTIVDFEVQQFTAQLSDLDAGRLDTDGARGGPVALASAPFFFGFNEVGTRTFSPVVMRLFSAWAADPAAPPATDRRTLARQKLARGEKIFNTRQFTISGVRGFNDELGQASITGTCSSCHSTPNVGTHALPRLMDTGVASADRRSPDMPLYTLRNIRTGQTMSTTDPGAALQTGKWADISKMKVPSLRGIESRSPYFHDGSESDISELLRFYDRRFSIGLTSQEIDDLAAFIKAL